MIRLQLPLALIILHLVACAPVAEPVSESNTASEPVAAKSDADTMFTGSEQSKSIWDRVTKADTLVPDQLDQLFADTISYLDEVEPTKESLDLAIIVTQVVYGERRERQGDAYQQIADLVSESKSEELRKRAAELASTARQLRLIGQPIEVTGKTVTGESLNWSDYEGKVVLIDFWATWCGACIEELPNVVANYERYHDRGFEVIGITADQEQATVAAFLQKENIPWPNLFDSQDTGHPMAIKYGVISTPTVFLVDQNGVVVSLDARGPELSKQLAEIFDEPAGETNADQTDKSETENAPSDDKAATIITNSIGMKLATIPAGRLLMGTEEVGSRAAKNEEPQHPIRITQPFFIGIYEVTRNEYKKVMGTDPSVSRRTDKGRDDLQGVDTSRFPVDNISWFAATEFCNRLSANENRDPCYRIEGEDVAIQKGNGYRLPTEAEWEYACRCSTASVWHFGNDAAGLDEHAWFGTKRTSAVGQKRPNGFGLHDMYGNVWELCQDWYSEAYYQASPSADPTGPATGQHRVIRGGSWFNDASRCRSGNREGIHPASHYNNFGFRVVRVA